MSKRPTIKDKLNALAQHPVPEPFHSHLEQVHGICRAMRDQASQLGMKLKFTPDGRFVGDVGELIAALKFGVKLHPTLQGGQDGTCTVSGHSAEVKLRTKAYSEIWVKSVPDILLVIYLCPESFKWGVVYNGPGAVVENKLFGKYNASAKRFETSIPKMLAASDATHPHDYPVTLKLLQVH